MTTAATAEKLAKLNIHTEWDALLHLPLRYEDETRLTPIRDTLPGQTCLVEGQVLHQEIRPRPRPQLIAQIRDASGSVLYLRFLNFYPGHRSQTATGKHIRALGEIREGFYGREMVHPKIRDAATGKLAEHLTPVYPTVSGLRQSTLRRIIRQALDKLPNETPLPDGLPHPPLPSLADSLNLLHNPPPDYTAATLTDPDLPARQRLKFEELLAQQLSMRLARKHRQNSSAAPLTGNGSLSKRLSADLPFPLTAAQQRVLAEIRRDLSRPHPMNRLLQGDVGSGKTITAALSMLTAVEAGTQTALMAPTEILAEQHYQKLCCWFEPLGIQVARLYGSQKKREKQHIKAALADGRIAVAVGTHALFQDDVVFQNLGLAVIDEQHRFGVAQRLSLRHKGNSVHQLMMSATPIPRTLAMSFFADLDVSIIDSLPPGRSPVQTRLVNTVRRHEVEGFVLAACSRGRQAYWVCPLIEESDQLQLQAAAETFRHLQTALPELNIGLIHGRMKAAEKAAVMQDFASGKTDVLVATTVIEVGVDVANATVMVIEHAERMGVSQLHQLRGRVGRGSSHSSCVLLFAEPLSETARERLKIIYEHNDGFEIARLDLKLRGPGELLGARQSGLPMLRFADPEHDLHLLEAARETAAVLLEHYPETAAVHISRWLPGRENYLGA